MHTIIIRSLVCFAGMCLSLGNWNRVKGDVDLLIIWGERRRRARGELREGSESVGTITQNHGMGRESFTL